MKITKAVKRLGPEQIILFLNCYLLLTISKITEMRGFLIAAFNRLSIYPTLGKGTSIRNIVTNTPTNFRVSPVLLAEPLKKKKRLDPAVIRAREERKKKKIEKQIRKLEKNARQLKPIEECEVSLTILDERSKRERHLAPLSEDVLDKRAWLEKKWCQYKREQHLADVQMLDRISYAQQRALDELRKESEELYQEAIQFDYHLLPFKSDGPTNTPAIENYNPPDGDYLDVSKKW